MPIEKSQKVPMAKSPVLKIPESNEESENFICEEEKYIKDVFDRLKIDKSSDTISVKDFLEWSEVVDLKKVKVLDDLMIETFLDEVQAKKKGQMNLNQFEILVSLMNQTVKALNEHKLDDDGDGDGGGDADDDDDDDDDDDGGGGGDNDDNYIDDEEFEAAAKECFDELRGKSKKCPVKKFLAWNDLAEMVEDGLITTQEVEAIVLDTSGLSLTGEMDFDQFLSVFYKLDELTSESSEDDDDDEDEDGGGIDVSDDGNFDEMTDEEFEESTRELYAELRGKSKKLSVKSFLQWEDVQEVLDMELISKDTLNKLIESVCGSSARDASLSEDEFVQLVKLLEDVVELSEDDESDDGVDITDEVKLAKLSSTSTSKITPESVSKMTPTPSHLSAEIVAQSKDEEDNEDDYSDEELEEMAREVFDQLRGKRKTLTVKKLKEWDEVASLLESGELTKSDVNSALEEAGVDIKTGEISFEQFSQIMETIDDILEQLDAQNEEEEEESTGSLASSSTPAPAKAKLSAPSSKSSTTTVSTASSKGFGSAASDPVLKNQEKSKSEASKKKAQSTDDADEDPAAVAEEIFDDLRGNKKVVTVKQLKEWKDMDEMIESGMLKRSTLEKAIVKVGAYESGEMNLDQFVKLIEIIMDAIDMNEVVDSVAKKGLLSEDGDVTDEEDLDNDDEGITDEDESGPEEESAREMFDELRGDNAELPLVQFLQWEDVQELLDSGALAKDDLAGCIDKVGIAVDGSGNASADLSFDAFFDLITLIDEYVDKDKLRSGDDDDDAFPDIDISKDQAAMAAKIAASTDEVIAVTKPNKYPPQSSPKGVSMNVIDEDEDEEVLEMFEELSKGKDYITEKALRKWDELQELVDSELASQDMLDGYFRNLDIRDGKVSYGQFRKFMSLLDNILVDESGNLLGLDDMELAVDLSDVEDEDDDDDDDDDE